MNYLKRIALLSLLCITSSCSNLNASETNNGQSKSEVLETELKKAAYEQNIALAESLLKNGANPNHFISENRETLVHAPGSLEMLKLLIKYGGNVEALDDWNMTPLYSAVHYGELASVDLLLRNGADPNHRDIRGRTPLHMVNSEYQLQPELVINLLIRSGADLNAKNNEGRTPLANAVAHYDSGAFKALLDAGANQEGIDEEIISSFAKCKCVENEGEWRNAFWDCFRLNLMNKILDCYRNQKDHEQK
ncbi:ankyrin repeat domain-containing protein [Candidatus Dependentiae bacterium]|nr:ankyrin repeat domain-containing protein [Candidatus Dependentiae bacterium]